MNKYSVLMVDDEQEVTEVIMRKLNWEELGFRVCGSASNGAEALEMAEELQPDVVMTDIKMPYMDGLELSRHLKSLFPDIRIIIFSGFDEFEYAKEAIRLEAEEYLLKPIDSAEVRRVFEKVHKRLDEDRDRRSSVERLEEYYQNSLPLLRENFFMSLMEGHISEEKLRDSLEDYSLKLDGPVYVVSIVHVSASEIPEGLNPRLLHFSVRELAQDYFEDRWRCYVFSYRGNILVLSQLSSQDEISAYTDDCDRFCRLARRSCKALTTVGISRTTTQIREISSVYDGAREAVSYRVIYGTGKAINIQEIAPESDTSETQFEEILQGVFKQIRMGNEDLLKEQIGRLSAWIGRSGLGIREYRLVLMDLVTGFYRFCTGSEIDIERVSPEHEDIYTYLLQMDSAEDIGQWLLETSERALAILRDQRMTKTQSFVTQALEFVRDHYSDSNLDLEMVCSSLGVSAAYFSTVFKKETGSTFISYLTDYRMKEAIRLMDEEDEKTYITAEKVGYADPNYFSYVFKKKFGMSPTRYRKTKDSKS